MVEKSNNKDHAKPLAKPKRTRAYAPKVRTGCITWYAPIITILSPIYIKLHKREKKKI
jgi:hypothetical protein